MLPGVPGPGRAGFVEKVFKVVLKEEREAFFEDLVLEIRPGETE
jgi:hypothetical protein